MLEDGKWEDIQSLVVEEDAEKISRRTHLPSTSTFTVYPRSKLMFVSRSRYTVLPTPPLINDTSLESAVGKAQLKEKDKLAWKFER